ncbi:MAG: CapA family protein, partial [Candidatus Syntrophonatronum acetioxidans]
NNFEFIKPYLEKSHLALANLETTFGGRERGYSGYPLFNTPDALASGLKFAGFDVISTANNHSLDTGREGLVRTLRVLEEENLPAAGTRSTPEEKGYVIKNIEGIKVGISAYTYETPRYQGRRTINGIALSPELEKLIDSFGYETLEEDLQDMKKRVERKKEEGAELIIFYLHWGEEYQREPNSYQEKIARELSTYGVDIIFGSHPHVLQPVEFVEGEGGHQTLVVYSMGNFISNQRYEHLGTRYTEDGIIVNVTVKKDFLENQVFIEEVSYIPTWVHRYDRGGRWVYEILPLVDALENKAVFNLNSENSIWRAQNSLENTLSILESRGIPVNLESPLPPESIESFK